MAGEGRGVIGTYLTVCATPGRKVRSVEVWKGKLEALGIDGVTTVHDGEAKCASGTGTELVAESLSENNP